MSFFQNNTGVQGNFAPNPNVQQQMPMMNQQPNYQAAPQLNQPVMQPTPQPVQQTYAQPQNQEYYAAPTQAQPQTPQSGFQNIKQQLYYTQGMLPLELSFIENILRMNKGKVATIYMSFPNANQWQSKIFKGVIEAAGRDHIIISDPNVGTRFLLLTIYLDYVTFDDEINYYYPL
ncbi:MAG: spore coat protein GerQ [Bacilli bacterium]